MELDLLRRACEVGVGEAVGWRMGWRRRGALAPLCPHQRLCAASAPLRHLRSVLYYPLVRGRCDHASVTPPSTQCFFFSSGSPLFMSCCQPASKVAHVFLSTHGASLCLWRVGALSTVTSLSCSSIQVMMRPARLPIVRFGPLIPTPWRAERSRARRVSSSSKLLLLLTARRVLPRSASPSAVKENQRYSAPRFLRQTGDARPLSAARTRHAVQR